VDVSKYLEIEPAPRVLFNAAAERGDRPRFMVEQQGGGWAPVTWTEFATEVRRCALWLDEQGVGQGDFCAIFADNSVQWLAAALAIQTVGAAMVPIYGNSTVEQARYVLEHSDARVLFHDCARERIVARAGSGLSKLGPCVTLDLGWSAIQRRGSELSVARPDRVAELLAAIDLDRPGLMLYTSGTSGRPKGVPLTHRNVGANGRDWLLCNGPLVQEGFVDLLWLPMSHIFGFGEACLGNTLGFCSYMCWPATVFDHLPTVRPHVFMSVPAYFDKIATLVAEAPEDEQADRLVQLTGGRFRFCLSGGAGLKREVKELFWRHGVLIVEGYGLTEAAPTLTLNRPDAFRFDTVGKPLPSVELRLADDGEILARGANVFSGYHKDPAATAEAFTVDGWLKTGDIGRFTDDGFVQIVDRKKDILVTAGGKNIPPANIELRFADEALIEHLVVYGDGKRYLTAGVWLNAMACRQLADDSDAALRDLVQRRIDAVNADLPRYETIKRFGIFSPGLGIANGMLTPTLKIRRKSIYEAFRDDFEALYTQAPAGQAPERGGARR